MMNTKIIKPMFKNRYAICFACDDNYVKLLCCSLASLLDNSSKNNCYDIVILSTAILEENKHKILKLVNNCINIKIRIVEINNELISCLNIRKRMTSASYLRLFIFDLFKMYAKIIYLDCDTIIKKDIFLLFNENLEQHLLGCVRSYIYCSWCFEHNLYSRRLKKYLLDVIHLDNPYNYINCGVILFNMSLLVKNGFSLSKLLDIAHSREWFGMDEDVINFVFSNKIKFLDSRWNVTIAEKFNYYNFNAKLLPPEFIKEYLDSHINPFILHYAGAKQPIYSNNIEYADQFWKYAKKSGFYNELLDEEKKHKKKLKFVLKNIIQFMLPRNSRRWIFVKKWFRLNAGVNIKI